MKVLLIEPPISPFDVPSGLVGLPEPLALETIAALISVNHDVMILDMRIDDSLDKHLETFKPDVVGVGAVTANLHLAKGVLKKAKLFNSKILTMIGGHHVTFLPGDATEDFIDIIVIGEGDYTASQIINAFEKNKSFNEIPGIVINKNGSQFFTKQASLAVLDELPIPNRSLTERYRNKYFQRYYRPIVSINTSRGCPHKCLFCMLWKMNRGKYRVRSAELVFNEMKNFKEEFVDFIDDNSIEDVRRMSELATLLERNRINKKMKMYGRADTIAKNPHLISKLKSVGLEIMLVGFESSETKALEIMGKNYEPKINTKAIEILQANNIEITSYFVVDPSFTESDFERTWNYVDKMNLKDPIFTILLPLPGSELFEQKKNEFALKDYRLFDFFHSILQTKIPLHLFYECFANLYKKSYNIERQSKLSASENIRNSVGNYSDNLAKIFARIENLKNHHDQILENNLNGILVSNVR